MDDRVLISNIRENFKYSDGSLIRIIKTSNANIGDTAGYIRKDGYRYISINGVQHLAHRLIFAYFNGFIPNFIDHINMNRLDNRIENLRACTRSENRYNTKAMSSNTSGAKGVTWHSRVCKWQVRIGVSGVRKHFGYFEDFELAELVAREARDKYHKDFSRHY